MMGHNICFKGVLWEIIPKISLLYLLMRSTVASELQIGGGIENNSEITFLIPQQKHML